MTSPRLPTGPSDRKAGLRSKATHIRHCVALGKAIWFKAAEVARITKISERQIQRWTKPHETKEGPFEKAARLLEGMIRAECEDPFIPLRELNAQFGFGIHELAADDDASLARKLADSSKSNADLQRALVDALEDDGQIDPDEAADIRAAHAAQRANDDRLLQHAEKLAERYRKVVAPRFDE